MGAEYNTTLMSILAGCHPSMMIMRYAGEAKLVTDIQVIHRSYITESCLIPRTPLSGTARRAGWQGCLFSLDNIPKSAKIDIVSSGIVAPRSAVQQQWKTIQRLLTQPAVARGWTSDVLKVVDQLGQRFTLQQVYSHETELSRLHPQNLNVKPKIRQQLQVLRDVGIVEFIGNGDYIRL